MLTLEEIAKEGNKEEEDRNPAVLLSLINEYYAVIGMTPLSHPDDCKNHATKTLGKRLGFKDCNTKQLRQRLVDLKVFYENLADENKEVQRKAIENIIANFSTAGFSTFYLVPTNPYAEDNRRLIASSPQIKDYLLSIGVSNPDDVFSNFTSYKGKKGKHIPGGLGRVLGFNRGNTEQMQQRLVYFGIFSQNLADYSLEIQERIIEHIFNNISKPIPQSFFVREDNPYAEENRKIIVASRQMEEYLASIGVVYLDDIESEHATQGLATLLDLNPRNARQMQQRLVDLEKFSPDLSDSSYDGTREAICQNLVDKLSRPKASYYTSVEDKQLRESNIAVILASNAVKNFFQENGYDPNNPTIVLHDVELFLRKYIGIDIDGHVPKKNKELHLYRRQQKRWSKEELDFLRDEFFRRQDRASYIGWLNDNSEALQKILGVSYLAMIAKIKYMGLI